MMVVMIAITAFAIDVGYMCLVRNQAQNSADAAALAAAWDMVNEDRLRGDYYAAYANARTRAAEFAAANRIGPIQPQLLLNQGNADLNGDIILGRLEDPSNHQESLSVADFSRFNTVFVRVRCTANRNQGVPLFFARALGFNHFETVADAAATFDDNVVGFRPQPAGRNASLIPFTIHVNQWNALLSGDGIDEWSYDSDAEAITGGGDSILEMRMFPNDTEASGNFGTLEFGDTANATGDLVTQIEEGVSAEDLAAYGGALELSPLNGSIEIAGDPGMSAGLKSALHTVKGRPVSIAIHDTASDGGNNTRFRVVGFVGVRVVDFWLDGTNWKEELDHRIQIQPAYVSDPTAITSPGIGTSYFIGQPVHLSR
jgi:hypothetical protein